MSHDGKVTHLTEDCQSQGRCKKSECLYNHQKRPPCRNGLKCERFGCWYNHFDLSTDLQKEKKTRKVGCRYGKSCKSKKCIFNHPGRPPCRSGDNCFSKFCWYNHPTLVCIHRHCKKEKDSVDPCPFRHSMRPSEQVGSWRDRDENNESDSESESGSLSDDSDTDDGEDQKPDPEKRIHLPVFEARMRELGCYEDKS